MCTLLEHRVSSSTQPARWILEGRCTADGWAANISWTGTCLFLQLLATWDHKGRESASLLLSLPRPQGSGDHRSLDRSLCLQKHRILAKAGRCCCCCRGRGRLPSAIPQLTRSSLNEPVTADTGLCRFNTRHSYWQGWLCFGKGCAQAVAGWKANTFQKRCGEWNGLNIKKLFFCDIFLGEGINSNQNQPQSRELQGR